MAIRRVIEEETGVAPPPVPANRPKKAYGTVAMTESASLTDNLIRLSSPIPSDVPLPMEDYGTGYGYIAYETKLGRDYNEEILRFEELGDRAQILLNGRTIGILYINDPDLSLRLTAKTGDTLTVLVENMGRANFGPKMMRKKGLAARVLLHDKIHFSWNAYPLPMTDLDRLAWQPGTGVSAPAFFRGTFTVDEPGDTFLRTDSFRKGFAVLNGFNLGRYWEIGPQKTLYMPASLLRKGENVLILFEGDGLKGTPEVSFTDRPELG